MLIAILTVEYTLHGNDNLKAKRRVANSLKTKVRNTFNVAIAEAGTENSLTKLRLQVVSLSNEERHLRSRIFIIYSFLFNKSKTYPLNP